MFFKKFNKSILEQKTFHGVNEKKKYFQNYKKIKKHFFHNNEDFKVNQVGTAPRINFPRKIPTDPIKLREKFERLGLETNKI